jgi:aminoglycoside phosphotransferase (APT) family kinase protein
LAESFGTDILAELIAAHVDANPAALRFKPVKTGKHNSSFWVHGDFGRLVLRIAPRDDVGFLFYERLMMRQEPELHALIRAQTSVPVAEIVGYGFERDIIDRDYLLMRALDGTPLSDVPHLSPSTHRHALCRVGEYLRQLHNLEAESCLGFAAYGYLGAHRPMSPEATWTMAFQNMWNLLLNDVVACGTYAPDEADWMRQLLDRHLSHFEHPVIPRLLHMDVWSQNILIDETGEVTGLVDFDRALWGDVEIEFAVLDYCGISEPAFWEGYGQARDVSPSAMVRQQFYLLYEVQKYMPIRVWRRNDFAGALRYKEQSFALARQMLAGQIGGQ